MATAPNSPDATRRRRARRAPDRPRRRLRLRRRRQVHPDRPAARRDRERPGRHPRLRAQHPPERFDDPQGGGRLLDAHRRPRGRARAGHHDRCRLPAPLPAVGAPRDHRGRTRSRAVHPQHGGRCVDRGRRDPAGRRLARHPAADPPSPDRVRSDGRPLGHRRHQQDGHRRLQARGLRGVRGRRPRGRRPVRPRGHRRSSRSAPSPATTSSRSPTQMPWFHGPTVLEALTSWRPAPTEAHITAPFRLPIQYVVRADDFRGYAGTVVAGSVHPGDKVVVNAKGATTTVERVARRGPRRRRGDGRTTRSCSPSRPRPT